MDQHRSAIEKLCAMAEWFGDVNEDLNDQIESIAEAERIYDGTIGAAAAQDSSDLVAAWLWSRPARERSSPLSENLSIALAASLLARDPDRLASLSGRADNTEELDDGSLLRVTRTRRGFRIEHVIRSGDAPPEQVWDVDEHGRAIR